MKKLIILITSILLSISLFGCSTKNYDSDTGSTKASKEAEKTENKKPLEASAGTEEMKTGETVTLVSANGGSYKLTIGKDVVEKVDREDDSDNNPKNIVTIPYTYEDLDTDGLFVSPDYFTAYDEDGDALEAFQGDEGEFPKELSSHIYKNTMSFVLNSNAKYVKIVTCDPSQATGKPCSFVIKW